MPAATDKFKKVGNPGTATTLSAPGYTVGATSLTVASTTNHPTDTGVCVSMYEVTTVGTQTVMTPGSYNEYNGVVSGATSITSLSHVAGSGTDRNYAAGTGTVVTIMVSSGRENDLIDGLLVSHNQDGTLKTGSVTTLAITDASVTNAKLSTTAGEVGGAFLAHTPTVTAGSGTITTATGSTAYIQVGKIVYFTTKITITNNGTGALYVNFTLPVTMKTNQLFVASGRAGAVSGKMLQCYINVTTNASIYNFDNSYPAVSGETLVVSGFYEAA